MTSEMQIFKFNESDVRTVQQNDEIWFVAKDIASVLNYSDAQAMTRILEDDEVQNRQIVGFGNRGVSLINESGLYSVILRSDKPNAKLFRKWVTSEVLPTIRKTGNYNHKPDKEFISLKRTVNELALKVDAIINTTPALALQEKGKKTSSNKVDIIFREVSDSGFTFEFTKGEINSALEIIDTITNKYEPLFTYNGLLCHTKLSPLELQYMLKLLIRIKKIRIYDQLRSDKSVLIQYIRRQG